MRIPGTSVRVGLDPIIGLIPGAGDLAGAALGGWLILLASREGAPRGMLLRMLANVGVDALLGSVPLLGDLFDAGYKANMRNVALLERHMETPRAVERSSAVFVAVLLAALILLVAGGITVAVLVVRALLNA